MRCRSPGTSATAPRCRAPASASACSPASSATDAGVGRSIGDVDAALAQAVKRVEADYEVPFLAHATMEPQNCTAHVTADRVEVWAPTQDGETALATAADAAGVPASRVVVHKMMLGGGFGRRGLVQDFVRQAVLIAKEIGQPVKLVWTREEDIRHDFYRPVVAARMIAGLDADGMPVAWKIRTAGQSIIATIAPHILRFGADKNFLQGLLEDMPYDVPNYSRRLRDAQHACAGRRLAQRQSFAELRSSRSASSTKWRMRRATIPITTGASCWRTSPRHLAVLDAAAAQGRLGQACASRRRHAASRCTNPRAASARMSSRLGGERRQRARAPRGVGDRRRPRGQSAVGRIADRERDRVRADRRALWRDHHQGRPGRAIKFR